MAKKSQAPSSGKRKRLGKWAVSRKSETELIVTLPKGMNVTGPKPTIEDLIHAIATKMEDENGGIKPMCCHGDVAIV